MEERREWTSEGKCRTSFPEVLLVHWWWKVPRPPLVGTEILARKQRPVVNIGMMDLHLLTLRSRTTANSNRLRILDLIRQKPGITRAELRRSGSWSSGTVEWHLDRLLDHRIIRSVRSRRNRTFYAAEVPPDQYEHLSATQRNILLTVLEKGPLAHGELATAIDVNPSTISRGVAFLLENDLVETRLVLGRKLVFPAQ